MRKFYCFLLLILFALIFFSCKKNYVANNESDFENNARTFFNSNVKTTEPASEQSIEIATNPSVVYGRNPIWNKAVKKKIAGKDVLVVPIQYDSLFYVSSNASGGRLYLINEVSRLCIYKDQSGQYQAEVVTMVPDNSYFSGSKKSFSGIIHVDTWDGTAIRSYLFRDGTAQSVTRSKRNAASIVGSSEDAMAENGISILEICYYFEGYNYAPAYEEGYYYEEELGCTYEIVSTGNESLGGGSSGLGSGGYSSAIGAAGGTGGGALVNPISSMPVARGDNIIASITDYNKCFTNLAGNTYSYSVTICVDQPVPGKRDPWGFTVTGSSSGDNIVNVGHTFLIFTQISATGTVQRNVGFYPADYVTPISPSDNGQLNNDNAHSYNISLTVQLDNSQFFNMLNYVNGNNNPTYNLNNNNCTSFALHTLEAGNVYIPASFGSWAGGGGYDPGDLGEDIRNMALQPGMSRSTNDLAHPNLGTCIY